MTGDVRFSILGPVRAWRDGVPVELGSPQQQLVVAVLLLRGGALTPLDDLIRAVWGDAAPRTAAGTLRTYVSRLRRVLDRPGPVIESMSGGYALRVPDDAVDLTVFHRLTAAARSARHHQDLAVAARALADALRLWRGTPLAGLPGAYASGQRERLARLRLDAVVERIEIDMARGRHSELAVELSALVVEHPLDERLRELAMVALHGSGRPAEALDTFRDVQRRLAAELGTTPGPQLHRLQQQILQADADPAAHGVPSQLPPALPGFTGRQSEIAEVRRQLRHTVVAITGIGGAGKTALAVHVAHAMADDFPDGRLHVDLAGTTDAPAEPYDVLGDLLSAYGQDVPRAYGERVALWRTVLDGRRVLMVLDDARESAQVADLLPATGGSAAVVTSRRRLLDLPGAHWLKLDPLPGYHAILLERLPRGYRQLSADEARAFRRLAVPDDEFIDVHEAASILRLTEPEAEAVLETLADLHLVEAGRRGRYRYAGPIKRFARQRARVEDGVC